MTAILELVGLTAGYGDLAAVRDVNLEVHAGEVVALFGPNGAGKTTTLLTVAGELPPLAGEVRLLGQATHAPLHRRVRQGLAFVPEERSVVPQMSARDNLRLGKGGVEGALAIFPELEPLLQRPAGLLSGGEQQMLTLARSLALEPTLLLADELSLGLAPLVVDRLMTRLRQAADDAGVAVILVEQQAKRALAVADRWYLLRQGEIAATGDRSTNWEEFEAAYLSDSTDDLGTAVPDEDKR
ncbi:ABC transporter ATP-binding protein [Aeromicrobium panaciterrae]|uniref:ABC transporter ATP-binding protein n=1 Tax=Aeromicrobium panaciterrae TaxID=363861 RepID=UPI0031E11EA2